MMRSATSRCTKNLRALSITSLSSRDPISRLPSPNSPSLTPIPQIRTSKPRYTSYDTSNSPATIALSTDVHQQSRLPTLSAIPMQISPATKTTENPTLATFSSLMAAQSPGQPTNNTLSHSPVWNRNIWHSLMLHAKQLLGNNSFKNSKFPPQFVLFLSSPTVKRRSIFLTILPNIAKPNTSMYAIMLCAITFTTAKFKLITFPRNINLRISSRKH